MARADTFSMEKGGYIYKDGGAICGEKPNHRGFYYPTYMNGDAEWLGDYCENHKGTSLKKVAHGKIPLKYELPEYPNVPLQ